MRRVQCAGSSAADPGTLNHPGDAMTWTYSIEDVQPSPAQFTHTFWRRADFNQTCFPELVGPTLPSEQIARWFAAQQGVGQSLLVALSGDEPGLTSFWLGARGRSADADSARELARTLAKTLSEVLDPLDLILGEPCESAEFGEAWGYLTAVSQVAGPAREPGDADSGMTLLEAIDATRGGAMEPWAVVMELMPSDMPTDARRDAQALVGTLQERAHHGQWFHMPYQPAAREGLLLLQRAHIAAIEAERGTLRVSLHGARPGAIGEHELLRVMGQYLDKTLAVSGDGPGDLLVDASTMRVVLAAIERAELQGEDGINARLCRDLVA